MNNKYVILFYNMANGNPADDDSRVTSPIMIGRMCDDLIRGFDVIDEAYLAGAIKRDGDVKSVTLNPTYADDVKDMG